MTKSLTNISLEVDTHNNGTYDIYLATENSSGESYENISADEIGEHVADLIDTLEEADSGKSYLTSQKTTKTILVYTDGYRITHETYPDRKTAKEAMEKEYTENNHNTPDDEYDEMSYVSDNNAILYDRGDNVHVWQIMEV